MQLESAPWPTERRERNACGELDSEFGLTLIRYLKYGVTVPEHIHHAAENAIKVATSTKAASVNGTGTVAAEPAQSGAEYLSPVNVGGTQMMLDFDTGSADL